MGLFAGKRPTTLGAVNGSLHKCSWKPNCVNSMTDGASDPAHAIAPLQIRGQPDAAWLALINLIKNRERVEIVTQTANYLHAEFKSRGMGYVDDVECLLDVKAGLIHMRSSSRLGIRDFGVNRARLESIRTQYAQL